MAQLVDLLGPAWAMVVVLGGVVMVTVAVLVARRRTTQLSPAQQVAALKKFTAATDMELQNRKGPQALNKQRFSEVQFLVSDLLQRQQNMSAQTTCDWSAQLVRRLQQIRRDAQVTEAQFLRTQHWLGPKRLGESRRDLRFTSGNSGDSWNESDDDGDGDSGDGGGD